MTDVELAEIDKLIPSWIYFGGTNDVLITEAALKLLKEVKRLRAEAAGRGEAVSGGYAQENVK